MTAEKRDIAKRLQAEINAMQGLGKSSAEKATDGFAPFNAAFPNNAFPTGTLHEFSSYEPAASASTEAFMAALSGKLMKEGSLCLWVESQKNIFPPSLKQFGLEPDRIVFIHAPKLKDALWTIEEALKCEAFTTVIGELPKLGFTESRRLQLAVERSGVTGFLHRQGAVTENSVACVARWKIEPLPSQAYGNLPGIGHSAWNVQLLKVRNSKPDSWHISWFNSQFHSLTAKQHSLSSITQKQVG